MVSTKLQVINQEIAVGADDEDGGATRNNSKVSHCWNMVIDAGTPAVHTMLLGRATGTWTNKLYSNKPAVEVPHK